MDHANSDDLALATARLLSSGTRLRLLRLLRVPVGGKPMCVNALAYRLGVSQAAVSQHLRRFEELGLVQARTTGVRTHYYLNEGALKRCLDSISEALECPDGAADSPVLAKGSR